MLIDHGGATTAYAQSFPAAMVPTVRKADVTPSHNATVFLTVKLNGNLSADLIPFTERDGQLYLNHEEAAQLGFSAEFLKTVPADTPLSAYPGVKANYDRGEQSVSLSAPFTILSLSTSVIGAKDAAYTVASASPGLLLNYDMYSSYTNKNDVLLSGFTELRAFSDFGVLSNSYLLRGHHSHDKSGWERTAVRMDTVLEHSIQDRQLTFRLGDMVTNGLSWTRQTRIGGFQMGRNFSLQPYQTTTPLPAYFGTAAVPSAVELYINGLQQYKGQVPAGPFELNAMPTVSGAGQAQVVLTDALGRRTMIDFPFYSSTRLLREGLTDWSFETGYVREDYGFNSFAYGREPMASGTIRHGFSNVFTGEGHVEATRRVVAGGIGAVFNIGTLGTVSASWAQSRAQEATNSQATGSQYSAGYKLQRGRFSLGANTQRSVGDYRDVASLYGGIPVLRSDSAYVGYSMAGLGNVGFNYAHLQAVDQPRYRYGGVSWSRSFFHGVAVSISANQNLDNRSDRSVYLNFSFNLDKGISAYASAARSQDSTTYSAGASRSADSPDGWSWNVQAQRAQQQAVNASGQVSKRAQYLDFNAGISSAGADQNAYVGASGSLVAMAGSVFASRRIYDGFAVVSTDGVPDVPVKNQNRVVGSTDNRGLLLVPTLQSFEHNKISIDPTNLPVDMRIERVDADAVPRRASGLNVKFKMERVQAATLILHRPDGRDAPMGAPAFLNGAEEPAGWVGYDGRIYLEGLQAENRLTVRGDEASCTVQFSYRDQVDTLPEIGPLLCKT